MRSPAWSCWPGGSFSFAPRTAPWGHGGLFIGAAFFGTLVWFLISVGALTLNHRSEITWIALICLSGLMALGLSWSHVRRRLTGQYDVDDVDQA